MAMQFEARKVSLKQDRTGFILTLSVHPDEIPEELMRDFVGSRYGCALVRIQDDETPTVYNNRVKKAGILCRDLAFKQFVKDALLITLTDEESAVSFLCAFIGVESRTELNGNKQAQDKFDELIAKYEEWMKHDDF
jgi:hypothetical protein